MFCPCDRQLGGMWSLFNQCFLRKRGWERMSKQWCVCVCAAVITATCSVNCESKVSSLVDFLCENKTINILYSIPWTLCSIIRIFSYSRCFFPTILCIWLLIQPHTGISLSINLINLIIRFIRFIDKDIQFYKEHTISNSMFFVKL